MWLCLRDAVPRHIERWLDGAEGERMTERELRSVEQQGWVVAHDLQGRFGNVDHLAVGPGGVYLLDSKNWSGEVTVANGVATVTPVDNPDDAWAATGLARRMRGASWANKEAFEKLTGVRTWIQPVVVVWAPFPQVQVKSDGIEYVAGKSLSQWLLDQPHKLTDSQAERLARTLSQ
jgi:hypothetical protein